MSSINDLPYTVTVIKVNPYRELYSISGKLTTQREQHRLPAFSVDANGNVTEIFEHVRNLVPKVGN